MEHDTIVGGEIFNGKIPKAADFWYLPGFMGELEPFGEDKLVAVLAGEITSREFISLEVFAPYFTKIETRGEGEFRACWRHGRNYRACYRACYRQRGLEVIIINCLQGVLFLILVPQASFLRPRFWAFCPGRS